MLDQVLSKLKSKLFFWRKNPISFVREVLGAEPTHHQAEFLSSLPKGRQFAIRSGHGTGKSAVLSWTIIWFLLTHPCSKVLCTAPSRRQLFDILWAEVYHWISHARLPELTSILQIQTEIIRVGQRKDWFARAAAVSVQQTPEEQAELLAGYHAEHICVIVDEASGVPDPVFRPLETYSTQPSSKIILAGNPTRNEGYFFRVFNDPSFGTSFKKFHWKSTESPLVDSQWVEEMKSRYGEDSPEFLIRVLGEFPPSTTDRLIPETLVRRQIYEGEPPIDPSIPAIWGIDIAHQGTSETAIVSRRGPYVDLAKSRFGLDSVQATEWILSELNQYKYPIKAICIDCSGGWGVGVADTLKRVLGPLVIPVNFGWSSQFEEFLYLRDELWFAIRNNLERGSLFLPPNEKLISQLTSVNAVSQAKYFRLEQKKSMRSRGIQSPDLGDARQKPRTRYARSWRTV